LKGVIALILHYFAEFDSFGIDYVKVVENKVILPSAEYYLSLIFWPKLANPAARSLWDS